MWLRPGSNFRISGYACLRDDRSDGKAGTAVFISRNYKFTQITLPPQNDLFNIVAVRVMDITFISLYIPIPSSAILSNISAILSSILKPVIILGDFNLHNTIWGSHNSESLSFRLLDILDDFNLCILNDGSPTRRVAPSQNVKSAVDLTLCSASLTPSLTWQVLPNSHGSDHYPILILLPMARKELPVNNHRLKYIISQADWNKFKDSTDDKVQYLPTLNSANVHSKYSIFKNAVLAAADESIPIRKLRSKNISSPPWWDKECTAACKKRKEAERTYTFTMTTQNFLNYQKIAAEVVKLLRIKKKAGWNSFCTSLSPKTPSTVIWKNIKKFRGSFIVNNTSLDTSSWIESFSQKIAPPSAPSLEEATTFLTAFPTTSDILQSPFSLEELSTALSGLKDSAPGVDGIPYSFIVKSGKETKIYFLKMINLIFESGFPPDEWKTQIIIPILKTGKPSNDPSSYRLIALSNTMSKILEHLIKNRLEWFLESNDYQKPNLVFAKD